MPARTPELPVENPSALIRSRIRERRIFEARFLCRQLSTEIEAREKHALERELTDLLAQVNTLRQLASQHIAEGRNDLAGTLYRDIEQIAIDVPGLDEEKKTLVVAEAFLTRIATKAPEKQKGTAEAPAVPEAPITQTIQVPRVAPKKPTLASELRQRLQQAPPRWLLAIAIGCLVALLLLLRSPQNRQVPPALPPSLTAPTKQTISIRPLESSPALVPDQPNPKIDPDPPAAEADPSPAPALQVEALQIQKSARE